MTLKYYLKYQNFDICIDCVPDTPELVAYTSLEEGFIKWLTEEDIRNAYFIFSSNPRQILVNDEGVNWQRDGF